MDAHVNYGVRRGVFERDFWFCHCVALLRPSLCRRTQSCFSLHLRLVVLPIPTDTIPNLPIAVEIKM